MFGASPRSVPWPGLLFAPGGAAAAGSRVATATPKAKLDAFAANGPEAARPRPARGWPLLSMGTRSGEQGKKDQKNAGGKNNSPQLWNVPGDPCPKDRPAAERQQDVQESDDNNLNIRRDRHWRAEPFLARPICPIRVYSTTSGRKESLLSSYSISGVRHPNRRNVLPAFGPCCTPDGR